MADTALADVFAADRRFLWALCYRMTGSAADADDVVQETFTRALERPPRRTTDPWRPWLVRVAMNVARDLLRRRKRRAYVGPWLPAPVETGDEESPPAHEPAFPGGDTTAGRYDLLESVSFAFLLALEALTPRQRAVLLLRDVFDYSVRQTADALDLSEENVKTTHHRARRAMASYDRTRVMPTRSLQAETRQALDRFVVALATGDQRAVEALLAADARAISDGGGEFHAARMPILGRAKVARFYAKIASRRSAGARSDVRMMNGLPALVTEMGGTLPGEALRMVMRLEIDAAGQIKAVYSVLASRKLTAVRFPPAA